jgi:hypothetical protein
MKIIKEKTPFMPVSIILETKKELDIFWNLMGFLCDRNNSSSMFANYMNMDEKELRALFYDTFSKLYNNGKR